MKTYFEFLRFSLDTDAPIPRSVRAMDWEGLFRFGKEQALLGVLFCGVRRLSKDVAPPKALLMQWFGISEHIRKRNRCLNEVAVDIYRRMCEDGFRCCLLKGQGNALMYDDVYSRTSGDIDLWICSHIADTQGGGNVSFNKHRERVIRHISEHFSLDETRYYHSEFGYRNVPIEAHFIPMVINNPLYNRRFRHWCRNVGDLQCSNMVELPDEVGSIAIPTLTFNLVYQLVHLYHHFFDEGIGMRQMCDYYRLLVEREREKLKSVESSDFTLKDMVLRRTLNNFGLLKFAGAVMWVLREVLGLSDSMMIVSVDERRGRVLLDEIVNGGNFGKHDKKYGGLAQQTMGRKYFTKVRRALSFLRYYPTEALCEPLFRTWHFFWRSLNR